jgi:serine/threonine protein kinase/tetratricopeptide (TPR) repeat protein
MSTPTSGRRDTATDLLFGLLALQNGLVQQAQLVSAFHAWTCDKARPLPDHLIALGHLNAAQRAAVEALAALHVQKHGGDTEKSLAALSAGRSTRERLAGLGDPEVNATLARVGPGSIEPDDDRSGQTLTMSVGTTTTDGLRFRVLRPHARGGLGAVFVALDAELNREVALKEILDKHADDPASRKRFLMEAEITGGLEHPGVVPVYGLGTYADGRPFYAMRFIKGDSLKEAIARFHAGEARGTDPGRHPLGLRKLLRRFTDVCQVIGYAHSRGVLHRDIKPGNVIVGKHGETLVVDWGLAKAVGLREPGPAPDERTLVPSSASGSAETLPGSALGTPAYMSPEQAAGDLEKLGPRSDVYSLGATLYCLLTGRPPFEGEAGEVLRAVQRGAFPTPRALAPSIDRALEAVCLKAMALKHEDRHATPGALAEDVERWMADEPVAAWREPWPRRARRWARRNRTAVTGAAAALVAGVIGLSAVAVVQARANDGLRRANAATTREKAKAEAALAETSKAKKATEAALAQSEQSRRRAEAVLSFLKDDVLAATRPGGQEGGLGKDVTVRKAVDTAEPKIAGAFQGQPAVEADVRETLGSTYVYLGEAALAIRQHERALELRRTKLGAGHPDTLRSLNNLANAYLDAGRTAEAIRLNEETLELTAAKLGADHPDTLSSRTNLAVAYRAAGRTAEAIRMHEGTLRLKEAKLGADHPDTLTSRNSLAVAYRAAGRTDEAIKLHERTLALREAKLGPDHPDTLRSRNNLATAYRAAGKTADAIRMHEGTLNLSTAKLGADHPETLLTRNNLAAAYLAAGRTAEAIRLLEGTLRQQESKPGPDHPETLLTRSNLAAAYRAAGKNADAIRLGEEALELTTAKLGADHPLTLRSRNNLATAYRAAGKTADAIRLHEETLRLREAKLGADHPDTLATRDALAVDYRAAGRTAEAIRLHEGTLELSAAKLGPDHPQTLTSRNNLATAYWDDGRRAEAIRWYEETLRLREAKLGADHPDTLSSRNTLAGTYESLGRWADAEPLWRDALARRRQAAKPDRPLLAGDLIRLGRNLLMQSKCSEAEPVLREGLAIRAQAAPDALSRFDAMSLLGGALLGQGRFAEAEPLVVQGYEGMWAREAETPAPGQPRLREAADRLVRLYEAWGQPEQAAAWKARLGLADLPRDVFARP